MKRELSEKEREEREESLESLESEVQLEGEESLKYFNDKHVFLGATIGAQEKLGQKMICWLYAAVFANAEYLRGIGMEPDYLQVLTIEKSKSSKNTSVYIYQEEPEHTEMYECDCNDNGYTGKVYMKENWNGTPAEKADIDDHYIMVYLPGED